MGSWSKSTAAIIAGSKGRGEPCTLLVFIDDATSKLMQLRFLPSESTASYFEVCTPMWRGTAALSRLTRTSTPCFGPIEMRKLARA